jgi:hypothetical protein
VKPLYPPVLLVTGLLFSQCGKTSEVAPKVNYDQKSAEIVQGVAPAVVGEWMMRRVHIKAHPFNTGQRTLGVRSDTIFQDFATLSIQRAPSRSSPENTQFANFTGFLRYKTKTYPVQFQLSATPQRLFQDKGPQALLLLGYNFPSGLMRPTEPEEQLLRDLFLLDAHFELEVLPEQPRLMTWLGASFFPYGGIKKIEFVKR